MDKKKCIISGQKQSCNLLGQKNHATSRDKKNHATSQDKKNHTTSWDTKYFNLSGQKKSTNFSGQNQELYKNQGDKTKSRNLLGQKNHATSQDKKQSCNLLGQKIKQPLKTKKNYAASWDNKNPAYGRHRISRPMRIVGPIPNFESLRDLSRKKQKKKNGAVDESTRLRVHASAPRGGDGRSAPTPRF